MLYYKATAGTIMWFVVWCGFGPGPSPPPPTYLTGSFGPVPPAWMRANTVTHTNSNTRATRLTK